MKSKEQLQNLFLQYLQGQCQPEEIDQILDYFGEEKQSGFLKELIAQHLTNEEAFDTATQGSIQQVLSKADQNMQAFVQERMQAEPWRSKTRRIRWALSGAAAAVLIALSIGIYTYSSRVPETQEKRLAVASEIRAIGHSATLTLADGTVIALREDQNEIVIGVDNITYNDGTAISQQSISTEIEQTPRSLTLSTPRGAQYQVTLPDGSKVWLNAASKLSYPERFTGSERRVELEGEAYFEVASNRQKPFKVSSSGQEVEVLGTHFNIQAYPDESETKTTLLEGAVQVYSSEEGSQQLSKPTLLSPGQQATLRNGKLSTQIVNSEDYASWKENVFIFHNTDLKSIMRQVSRWYDLELDLATIPDIEFYAEIPRNVPLSQVLIMLEETSNLKFRVVAHKKSHTTERRLLIEP
ncbi:FecR family protein [Sphingobacterium faecale]|uniref:FecR domain-containing protein n=1 Tax=Sphingobacterium faecale TaxID=2803775 RepID=A0ABS1R686_9SPHI|nr:FecR family protein [Sphingobacterium faecale]MBL1410209.1 FecR domain-containing protein [Sphingobacterium faecale]